jgi:two-component system CheB/CheR fusion protein
MSEAHPEQARGSEQEGHEIRKIVGIGASAGGLAALKVLFEGMPPNLGAAFVVVMHLAPERPSHLADLLQPHCLLPVLTVAEPAPLAPDRVYLIPPGRNLEAIDGRLRVASPETVPPRRPIDHLFFTIGDARDGDAVGVILSGAGSDGTEGARRLRARGGLVLVQDPEEAEYDGMPSSVIAAQAADRVLRLADIRAEILRFCRATPRLAGAGPAAAAAEEDLLDAMLIEIDRHTGGGLRRYRPEVLWPRIRRRMRLTGQESAADYLALLRALPEEAAALAREPQSPEPVFFADSNGLELAQQAAARLFGTKAGKEEPLRIWCAGCARREDAFSLAMLLVEEADRHQRPPELRIFAGDLDGACAGAPDGLYPDAIAGQLSAERLHRFFAHEAGGYRVRRELRDQIIFARHDLLSDPPFQHLDLVLCRGHLRLLTAKAREQVYATFQFALRPGGLLLLDPADEPGRDAPFARVEAKSPLWRRREGPAGGRPWPALTSLPPRPRPPAVMPPGSAKARRPAAHYAALHAHLAARYAPPSLLVDNHERVLYYSAEVGRYLRLPGGSPSHCLSALVAEPLRGELRRGLRAAAQAGGSWHSPPLVVATESGPERVALHLEPAGLGEAEWLVVFQPLAALPEDRAGPAGAADELQSLLTVTEQQLTAARAAAASERARAQTLDEELASLYEEYRCVVDELRASGEELQSTNEELASVTEENLQRIEVLGQLSADQQHLLEATGIPTLFLDRELRIMRYTPPAAELFRLRPGDRGRSLADLTHHLAHPGLVAEARQVLETKTPSEREVASDAGRWYLMRVLPYRPHADRLDGVVISLIDISARRQAEEALREADRRKDEFLATLAHELRDPLASLVSGLELLELVGDDPALGREVRERLDRQVRQLARLVDDLLEVSRITRGTFQLRKGEVDLTVVARDAIAAVESGARAKGHALSVALPDAPLLLEADGTRLTQVVSNLLSNAVKYTSAGGRIRLSVERQGEEAVVAVADNGMGIDPGQLEHAFGMFTRVGTDLHADAGGLGIGLALARQLAEMHGGTLTAHSEGPGKGSEFTLRLPLGAHQGTSAAPAAAGADQSLGGYQVLIADDNEDAVLSIAMLVRLLGGREVHTAHDGVEAVEKARALRPDIVMLDLGMPRMDGFEAARQIRREPGGQAPTLVALSGWGREEDCRRTQEAGFDHYLLKPADRAALAALFAAVRAGGKAQARDDIRSGS